MKTMCSALTQSMASDTSFAGGCHDRAQAVQLAVEEVVGAGHQHDRQLLRPRPVEHRGERHGLVELAMDHKRIGGHRRRLEIRHGNSYENQSLWLVLFFPG